MSPHGPFQLHSCGCDCSASQIPRLRPAPTDSWEMMRAYCSFWENIAAIAALQYTGDRFRPGAVHILLGVGNMKVTWQITLTLCNLGSRKLLDEELWRSSQICNKIAMPSFTMLTAVGKILSSTNISDPDFKKPKFFLIVVDLWHTLLPQVHEKNGGHSPFHRTNSKLLLIVIY